MELTNGDKQESVSLAIDLILHTIENAKKSNIDKDIALKILVENLGELR